MIQRGTAIATSDASVKDGCMGGCWIIANSDWQKTLMTNKLYHNQWEDNMSGVAEMITILELIAVLEKKDRHI